MPTSVALGSHFEDFVKEQVREGRFNNASEVVRAGLRLLEDQEQLQTLKLHELRAAIAAGAASGPGKDANTVFERLTTKYKARIEARARALPDEMDVRKLREGWSRRQERFRAQ